MSDTLLIDFREDLAERLRSDPYLSTVTVLTEKQKDTLAEINRAKALVTSQNGKIGLAVIVLDPVVRDELPNVPRGVFEISATIRILENPELNNTGKTYLELAKHVGDWVKHFRSSGIASPLIPDEPFMQPVELPIRAVGYDLSFIARQADTEVIAKVADVTISPASGAAPQTVTLTCSTAGASIYYTLDGSYPRSSNSSAVLYTAPIEITTPKTLRAGAYKSGSIASNISRSDYT